MNQHTIKEILKFRDDRDWKQFHNPKDLAISLSLEASELLENFQWKSSEDAIEQNFENIKDELADVLIYSILLADQMNLDIEEVIQNKLEKNKRKYPVEKSFGSNKKYNEL
ncbi:nucleotide pyrophosphohydrolase [Bacillus mycoides]|uniref:MazG nucleotide pyrophosphohydrolase n=1 Tax=Bacillus mycoides (strain KBAB4) TaxID=315730 RepID=A9VQW5_BACMK|nr:nucleotide pyrophosphohydrolase [Bacillus mycoides]ABY44614.1 MazG nucleotide pyrophosphohydrolase [Bacillus mycoides KBAB4]